MYVNLEGLFRLFISYLDYPTFVLFIEYSWRTPNKLSIFMLFYVASVYPSLTHIHGGKGALNFSFLLTLSSLIRAKSRQTTITFFYKKQLCMYKQFVNVATRLEGTLCIGGKKIVLCSRIQT